MTVDPDPKAPGGAQPSATVERLSAFRGPDLHDLCDAAEAAILADIIWQNDSSSSMIKILAMHTPETLKDFHILLILILETFYLPHFTYLP